MAKPNLEKTNAMLQLITNVEKKVDLTREELEKLKKFLEQNIKVKLEDNAELRQGKKAEQAPTGPSLGRKS